MAFYGKITNISKSQFSFDKIYPNRFIMDKMASKDGVYVGRYILVEYDNANPYADIYKNLYPHWDESGSANTFAQPYAAKTGQISWYWDDTTLIDREISGTYIQPGQDNDKLVPLDNTGGIYRDVLVYVPAAHNLPKNTSDAYYKVVGYRFKTYRSIINYIFTEDGAFVTDANNRYSYKTNGEGYTFSGDINPYVRWVNGEFVEYDFLDYYETLSAGQKDKLLQEYPNFEELSDEEKRQILYYTYINYMYTKSFADKFEIVDKDLETYKEYDIAVDGEAGIAFYYTRTPEKDKTGYLDTDYTYTRVDKSNYDDFLAGKYWKVVGNYQSDTEADWAHNNIFIREDILFTYKDKNSLSNYFINSANAEVAWPQVVSYEDDEIDTEKIEQFIDDNFIGFQLVNIGEVDTTSTIDALSQYYQINFSIDSANYNPIGRGFDSTVWQKIYTYDTKLKQNVEKYVMIAELNSVVPTLSVSADAPTLSPMPPHFDIQDSNNVLYKLHWQTPYGFRIKSADNFKENWWANGEMTSNEGYGQPDVSLDATIYPSDVTTSWERKEYNPNSGETYKYGLRTDSSSTPVWLRNQTASPIPAAIYYNKDGFDSAIISKAREGHAVHRDKDKTNTINDELRKRIISDNITLKDTGVSGHLYNHLQGGEAANDILEMSIMLPSLGDTISDIWDLVYGNERQNKDYGINNVYNDNKWDETNPKSRLVKRNKNIRWNEENDTSGLRLVKGDASAPIYYTNLETQGASGVNTIAGAINSAHDALGMIIRTINPYDNSKNYDGGLKLDKEIYQVGKYYISDEDDAELYTGEFDSSLTYYKKNGENKKQIINLVANLDEFIDDIIPLLDTNHIYFIINPPYVLAKGNFDEEATYYAKDGDGSYSVAEVTEDTYTANTYYIKSAESSGAFYRKRTIFEWGDSLVEGQDYTYREVEDLLPIDYTPGRYYKKVNGEYVVADDAEKINTTYYEYVLNSSKYEPIQLLEYEKNTYYYKDANDEIYYLETANEARQDIIDAERYYNIDITKADEYVFNNELGGKYWLVTDKNGGEYANSFRRVADEYDAVPAITHAQNEEYIYGNPDQDGFPRDIFQPVNVKENVIYNNKRKTDVTGELSSERQVVYVSIDDEGRIINDNIFVVFGSQRYTDGSLIIDGDATKWWTKSWPVESSDNQTSATTGEDIYYDYVPFYDLPAKGHKFGYFNPAGSTQTADDEQFLQWNAGIGDWEYTQDWYNHTSNFSQYRYRVRDYSGNIIENPYIVLYNNAYVNAQGDIVGIPTEGYNTTIEGAGQGKFWIGELVDNNWEFRLAAVEAKTINARTDGADAKEYSYLINKTGNVNKKLIASQAALLAGGNAYQSYWYYKLNPAVYKNFNIVQLSANENIKDFINCAADHSFYQKQRYYCQSDVETFKLDTTYTYTVDKTLNTGESIKYYDCGFCVYDVDDAANTEAIQHIETNFYVADTYYYADGTEYELDKNSQPSRNTKTDYFSNASYYVYSTDANTSDAFEINAP